MKKKGLLMSLFLVLLLSLALVGCNSNKSGGEEAGAPTEGETKEETTAPAEAEAPAGGDKVLVFGRGGDSVGLDPIAVTDGESFKVTKQIFDTLIEYGEQDTTIQPGLATEWDVKDEGLTYTLKLREGVKFHDGTDFNADAVVTNFDRWMNGTKDQFYYYASMFGGFKGDEGHVIDSVTAVDELTVEFKLKRAQAPFLKNLAMVPFAIASPAALEKYGDTFNENPVGTGPFKFVEWKRNDRVVLEKNEDFWMDGYPKLDRVIYQSIPDNSARLNALVTGEVDLVDGLNPSDKTSIESNSDLQLFKRPSMNVGYLGLTMKDPNSPLANKLVRQALNHAVDKQGLIDAFYAGLAEPAKNAMPPSVEGYNDAIEAYPYDLEKAKALLAEAGYADGFTMELWAMPVPRPYMPDGKKVAEVLQASFAQIGVKAEIVSFEWATYLDKARDGEADAFLLGWTGDNGDADNFLYVLLDKDNIGSNNYSYYSNDELHDILIAAQENPNQDERNELYKQAQEIIHDDAPWIPLVHSTPLLSGKANVEGFVPHPTGTDKLTTVDLK
ncbi:ABC transporter substrate-binding protein [Bacillus solimangrovi]|uniref:Peptide ABC transporter substrate-binding protein n=1 Tax=Bacillus solimangrovi TaxID=1305675 RepID=A0A1E5LBC8_9BACI|nr:ABC transporter substrate-binding protein [Bacillus solimangrovi]OEH91400.1 peptide ABC transporter substrate-binding protein [Bacillus solimangrovi]